MKESTVRSIRQKYQEELKVVKAEKRLPSLRLGRPFIHGNIDITVQNFLKVIYHYSTLVCKRITMVGKLMFDS